MNIYCRRMNKTLRYILHILYLVLTSYIINQCSYKTKSFKKINRYIVDIKHILLWTNIEGVPGNGQLHFINNSCAQINCYVTDNRSLFDDIRYFDAILFNVRDVSKNKIDVPTLRALNQKYIFVARDSADNFPVCDAKYDGFFNWTWTYRHDSTINFGFITIYRKDNEELGTHFQWNPNINNSKVDTVLKSSLSSKSIAAAIFLDQCKSESKREVYIENLKIQLAIYNLTIHIYGDCGMKCRRKSMAACFWRLSKSYYFYLALEDSISHDYVTSIVLNAYQHDAVPIVLGGAKYDKFLPPGSYINAMDYNTTSLALKIHQMIQNKQLYYDFFKWRNYYIIREGRILDPCELCEQLNNPSWLVHRASYTKMRKWWNPNYNDRCRF